MSNGRGPIGWPGISDTTSPMPFVGRFISGGKTGNGVWLTAVFAAANTDTSFTIALGSAAADGYIQFQASVAGTVYNGTNQGTDWTPTKIVLRASAIGSYLLWLS